MKKALLVIDLQNDYFESGRYPLWNAEQVLKRIVHAMRKAEAQDIPIILVQHIADSRQGSAPFFNKGSAGAMLHADIVAAAPQAPIVIKRHADSFVSTNLEQILDELEIEELLICGMMTQNCVTHTAISPSAAKYHVSVLQDCCTTVDEMLHKIALNALTTRLPLIDSVEAL